VKCLARSGFSQGREPLSTTQGVFFVVVSVLVPSVVYALVLQDTRSRSDLRNCLWHLWAILEPSPTA
jgi:hypothetical protein